MVVHDTSGFVVQAALFDYDALDSETRIVVQQRTGEIKSLYNQRQSRLRLVAQDTIDIGQKLIEVKARLGHGNFGAWLRAEFEWKRQTAQNFMNVAEKFSKLPNFGNLDQFAPSALYLLATPSTPEPARVEALARAEQGEAITHAAAKDIVQSHKLAPTYASDAQVDGTERDDASGSSIVTCAVCGNFYDGETFQNCPHCYKHRHNVIGWVDNLPELVNQPRNPLWDDAKGCRTGERVPMAAPQRSSHQLINQSISNEWYTPHEYIEAARWVMGGIDLDPASCAYANQTVQAGRFFTQADDGLSQAWYGRVWLNPPYGRVDGEQESNQARWTARLIEAYETGEIEQGILLVNAVTGNKWFKPLKQYPICFPDERIKFYTADNRVPAPTHSNALVYFGPNLERFVAGFSAFGAVMMRLLPEVA